MLKILTCVMSFISCASSSQIDSFLQTASLEYDAALQDPDKIVENDPRAGAHDCEEQAVILMQIIKLNKKFVDLDPKVQRYIVLRYLF